MSIVNYEKKVLCTHILLKLLLTVNMHDALVYTYNIISHWFLIQDEMLKLNYGSS